MIVQQIQSRLAAWNSMFNDLSLRERGIVVATLVTGIVVMFLHFYWSPQLEQIEDIDGKLAQAEGRHATLEGSFAALKASLAEDLDAPQRKMKAQLQRQLAQQEAALRQALGGMVEPVEMVGLLRQVLAEDRRMRVVKVSNQPAEELYEDETRAASELKQVSLYRRSIAIEVEADYFSALSWLRRLESLPGGLLLSRVVYEVKDHPKARVTLWVETIGLNKEWLGV